jgi:hypothetical protein
MLRVNMSKDVQLENIGRSLPLDVTICTEDPGRLSTEHPPTIVNSGSTIGNIYVSSDEIKIPTRLHGNNDFFNSTYLINRELGMFGGQIPPSMHGNLIVLDNC